LEGRKISLKAVLASAFLVAAVAVLAPPPAPLQHNPARKPVYFWHMWSGEYQPVVENICRRFNESQSTYEVIPLQIPANDSQTKFLLSAAGGLAPDLVSQWNPILGMWSDRKLLTPIDELMTPADRDRYLREAYPVMRQHAVYRGRIMALIAGVDVQACFYRLDHLREVGVDENHLPKTLEDVVALGKKLDRYDKDGRLTRIGFLPAYFENYVPSFGGKFNDANGPLLGTKEQRAALRFVTETYKRLGFQNVTRFKSGLPADSETNAPLLAGNFSIVVDGQWRVKQAADFAPNLQYTVAPLPPPAGGLPLASLTGPNYMVIPRSARDPQGALAFLKYWIGMDDREAGGHNVADMGWLPYCDGVAHSKTYQAYLKKYPHFKTFVDLVASPNMAIPPVGPLQTFIMDQIQKVNDSTSDGAKTPDQAMDEMVANVQTEIARQRRLGNGS
jgi:multiple sugar transport system substrate-binding protein